jgi:hypothetical protein
LLNIGGSGDQRIVEELHRANLQHVQDDLRIFGCLTSAPMGHI